MQPLVGDDTEASAVAAPPRPSPTAARVSLGARPADIAAAGAAAGFLALLPLPAAARALLLTAFIVLGPGAALLSWVHIPPRARLAAVPVLGMALTTIVTTGAIWASLWHPHALLVVGAAAVAASSGLWYSRHGWPERNRLRVPSPGVSVGGVVRQPAVILVALSLVIWAAALPGLPGLDAGFLGLLFSGTGPLLAVALVLCSTGFLLALRRRMLGTAVAALGAAIVISRLTTTLATEVPLYDWAYKHIAVTDYILTHNAITPDGTDIYAQWPSFFVVAAWFCDLTGLAPIALAHVITPAIHVLIALTVFSAARILRYSRRTALAAAYVVEIANWVGQDYFSPQSWAVVLAYGVLALLLASPTSRTAGVLAVIPFAAIVPSHQLTPFWLLFTAGLLVVTRRARPWWAVGAMAVIAGAYLVVNFDAVAPYGILSGGNPLDNASSNVAAVGTIEKVFTSGVCRGLSAVIFVSAAACALWLRRRGRPALAPALLAFSPVALLLGQSYGGEAIFRVYLYGLLGCGLLIAPAITVALNRSRNVRHRAGAARRGPLLAWVWVTVTSLAGLHAYVALWPMVLETRSQVDYMDQLTAQIEPGTRIIMMQPGGMPTRLNDHYAAQTLQDPYFDQPLNADMPQDRSTFPTADQAGAFQWSVENNTFPTYVVFSEQSNTALHYYQEYPDDSIEKFQQFLNTAPDWEQIHRDGQTVVYRYPGAKALQEDEINPGDGALGGTRWGGN